MFDRNNLTVEHVFFLSWLADPDNSRTFDDFIEQEKKAKKTKRARKSEEGNPRQLKFYSGLKLESIKMARSLIQLQLASVDFYPENPQNEEDLDVWVAEAHAKAWAEVTWKAKSKESSMSVHSNSSCPLSERSFCSAYYESGLISRRKQLSLVGWC